MYLPALAHFVLKVWQPDLWLSLVNQVGTHPSDRGFVSLLVVIIISIVLLNMPGRSTAAKEEPDKAGAPSPLLGAAGSTGQDDSVIDPTMGSLVNTHATASIAEGAHWWEKYSLLVHIFTARDRQDLEPHAWVKDLLKDFFQSTLGINLSVILLSPTECLIFCGNCTQGQGMSWDESLHYADQVMGIHPWTSYTVDVVALQWTLKEARHNMQVAKEFTHERTKQCIAHLNAIALVPVQKPCLAMPERSPRGWGLTRCTDQLFMKEQLRDLWITEPAFAHCPTLLGTHPETPDQEQYDSARDATSLLDAKLDTSTGEEMDASGCSYCSVSAKRHCWRNHALCRECNWACQEFRKPKNWWLSFPLFRETTKEDASPTEIGIAK